jgi:GTP cyclohydrolase II
MKVKEVARLELPTHYGFFEARAFEMSSGFVYLALSMGRLDDGEPVLARIHSECLTGDALHSLRCDCGLQLRGALRAIAATARGVLVYATGHEGRGIGLVNKLKAYVAQEHGADTVDANLHLGLPVDGRDYTDAAAVLAALGIKSVRLMTGNPAKVEGLERNGIAVAEVRPPGVVAHNRSVTYLETKRTRMGHIGSTQDAPPREPHADPGDILGRIGPRPARPYVAVKYAQSVDGRIATRTGDSRWISDEDERTVSHALRARCDAVMVGIGTVLNDDPQLTVRLVEGASPTRVVLDSKLRLPLDANILDGSATTIVVTTPGADANRLRELRRRDIGVCVVGGRQRVDLREALARLAEMGVRSLLVEGGGGVITSLLSKRLVDRIIVSCAPRILGTGIEAVGDLGTNSVIEGITLRNRSVRVLNNDVLMAWDVVYPQLGTSAAGLAI